MMRSALKKGALLKGVAACSQNSHSTGDLIEAQKEIQVMLRIVTQDEFDQRHGSYQTRVTGRCVDAVIDALQKVPVDVYGHTTGEGSKKELRLRIFGLSIRHIDPKDFNDAERDNAKKLMTIINIIERVLAHTPPADGDARFLIPRLPANNATPYLVNHNGSEVSYHAVSMSVGPDYGHSYATIEAVYHMGTVSKLNDIKYRVQRYEHPMEQFGQARAIGEPKIVGTTDKAIEAALGQSKPARDDNSPFMQYRRTLNQFVRGMAAELEPQRFKLQGFDLVGRTPTSRPFPDRGSCHRTISGKKFYVCDRYIGGEFAKVFMVVELRLDDTQPLKGNFTGQMKVSKYYHDIWAGQEFQGEQEFDLNDLDSAIRFGFTIDYSGPLHGPAELAFTTLRDDIYAFAKHLKLRPLRETGVASKLAAQLAMA